MKSGGDASKNVWYDLYSSNIRSGDGYEDSDRPLDWQSGLCVMSDLDGCCRRGPELSGRAGFPAARPAQSRAGDRRVSQRRSAGVVVPRLGRTHGRRCGGVGGLAGQGESKLGRAVRAGRHAGFSGLQHGVVPRRSATALAVLADDPGQHMGIVPDQFQGLLRTYAAPGLPQWDREGLILLKPEDFAERGRRQLDEELGLLKLLLTDKMRQEIEQARERMGEKLYQRLGWQPRCKPTQLPSGRILLPLYTDTFSISIMAISDDRGQTWRASQPLLGLWQHPADGAAAQRRHAGRLHARKRASPA